MQGESFHTNTSQLPFRQPIFKVTLHLHLRTNKVARMASIPDFSKHTPHQAAMDEYTPLLKDKRMDSQTQAASMEEGLKSPREESSFPPKDLSRVRMVLCIGPLMLCTFLAAMGKTK